MGDYPSETTLAVIKEWDILKQGLPELIFFIEDIWKYADSGYFTKTKRRLILATAGWSGNEDIIEALQQNYIFWSLCWMKSERGGRYTFQIKKIKGLKNEK
jgi:hypothetical protein